MHCRPVVKYMKGTNTQLIVVIWDKNGQTEFMVEIYFKI